MKNMFELITEGHIPDENACEIIGSLQQEIQMLKGKLEDNQANLVEAYKLIDQNLYFPEYRSLLDEVLEYNIKANKVVDKAGAYLKNMEEK